MAVIDCSWMACYQSNLIQIARCGQNFGCLVFVSTRAALAQLVEHIIRNDGVTCSSHVSGTTLHLMHVILP